MNKLTKVYTEWCGPCKMMTEILKDIDLGGEFNTTLEEIDAAQDKEILIKHQIRGVPYFILEDSEGNVLRKQSGAMTLEETRKFLAGA
jgi:thiol-disulfide isomerase/thioredoxin